MKLASLTRFVIACSVILAATTLLALPGFAQDRNLYVTGGALNGAWRFDGQNGQPLPAGGQSGAVFVTNNSGGIFNVKDLAFGPDGNLYMIGDPNAVFRYDGTTGAFIDKFVPDNSAGISNLTGIAFGPDGHLYLVGEGLNGAWRFDGQSGAPYPAPGRSDAVFVANNSGGIANVVDLAFGPDDNLYLIGTAINGVLRYDGVTGNYIDAFVPNNSGGIANLTAIAFGYGHDLYLTGSGYNGAWRFDGQTGAPKPGSGLSGAQFTPNEAGGLANLNDLAFDYNRDLYLIGNLNAVLKFDGSTGTYIGTFVPNNSAGIANLTALIFSLPEMPNTPVVPASIAGMLMLLGSAMLVYRRLESRTT